MHRRQRRALHGYRRAARAGILLEASGEGLEMIPFLLAGAGGLGLLGGGLAAFSGATARKIEKAVPRDGELIEVERRDAPLCRQRLRPADRDDPRPRRPAAQFRPADGRGSRPRLSGDPGRPARLRLFARAPPAPRRACGSRPRRSPSSSAILKLDRPLIVGHSLGGALALVARAQPSRRRRRARPDRSADPGAGRSRTCRRCSRPLVIRSPAVRKAVAWTLATPMGMMKAEEALKEVFAPEPVPADFGTEGGGLLAMRPEQFLRLLVRPGRSRGRARGDGRALSDALDPGPHPLRAAATICSTPSSTASGPRARYRAPRSSWSRAATCCPSPSPSSLPPSSAAPPPQEAPHARRAAG